MKLSIFFSSLLLSILYYNTAVASNLKVLATINPLHSLVSSVTDGILEPSLLIDGSVPIHDYALKPSDASKLESYNVIFYIDDNLETFMKNFAKDEKRLVQLSDAVTLLSARTGVFSKKVIDVHDLHIWLNPENAKRMIIFISETLSNIDKENSDRYNYNAKNAIESIDREVEKIKQDLSALKATKYIVTHDAYQYFEKYFNLSSPSATLETEEGLHIIGMKSLVKLRNKVRKEDIKCIFSHSGEIPNIILSDNMKKVTLDPIGHPGKNAYLAMINNIAQNFKSCFVE